MFLSVMLKLFVSCNYFFVYYLILSDQTRSCDFAEEFTKPANAKTYIPHHPIMFTSWKSAWQRNHEKACGITRRNLAILVLWIRLPDVCEASYTKTYKDQMYT